MNNELMVKDDFSEIATLKTDGTFQQLVEIMPEHKQMLEVISEGLPEIRRATSFYFKTQSQFMDNMLTVTAYTPVRNMRQILAEMNKTREAIKEAHFKIRKKEIEAEMKKRELSKETDDLKKEMLAVEIMEIVANAESTRGYLSGAIRKLTNYTEQYNSIMATFKLHDYTEEDFEKEEERYHIMKAFEQAMCAARSRGGLVDEGNMIYLTQIGINGAGAQREISEYLQLEQALLNDKDPKTNQPAPKEPTHKMFVMFLHRMAEKYAGCATKFAEAKGMTTMTNTALLKQGDRTLLEKKD